MWNIRVKLSVHTSIAATGFLHKFIMADDEGTRTVFNWPEAIAFVSDQMHRAELVSVEIVRVMN